MDDSATACLRVFAPRTITVITANTIAVITITMTMTMTTRTYARRAQPVGEVHPWFGRWSWCGQTG